MRLAFRGATALILSCAAAGHGAAQQLRPITRAEAVAAALAHNPRVAAAHADTDVAAARVTTAGAPPDPTLSASYSKDIPQYHVTAEMPVGEFFLTPIRLRAARAGQLASRYRARYDIASVALDADTSYTRALAALAHSRLSTRNAEDADSLRRMVVARRDAGDASDMDVELATLTAGQQANVAAADSVTALATLFELQAIMGLGPGTAAVSPVDSLDAPPDVAAAAMAVPVAGPPLLVASSTAALQSATLYSQVQHRYLVGTLGLTAGFDTGDPTGDTKGLLPTFGITIPLPILNRNRGPIAEADAERARASAELAIAQQESALEISRRRNALIAASSRLVRDRQLLASAARVAGMALAAYREGASPLANVLEAQRTARDVQSQYVDDAANALIAAATLRLITLTPASVTP